MAFSLNNTNAIFSISTPIAGYPFSLMGWFRVPDVNTQTSLMGLVSFSSGSRCDVLFAGDTTKAAIAKAESGSSGAAYSTNPMIPGTWHHLLAVFTSDTERSIYLDGSSFGVNTDTVSATALNFFYFGNVGDSTSVEIADVAFVATEVSSEQAVLLAKGGPVISTPLAREIVAYQDCIRQLNRPGLGPLFTTNGTLDITNHPRIHSPTSSSSAVMPLRHSGPWLARNLELSPKSAKIGQLTTAGLVSNNSILSGGVAS